MVPRIRSVTILDEQAGHLRTRGIPATWTVLRRELPQVAERRATAGSGAEVVVALARWAANACDPCELDRRLDAARGEPIDLQLVTGAHDDERAALEVLTRAQVFLPSFTDPEQDPDGEMMQRVLALVGAADSHAHDTHRWVLRLRPDASAALRIAALLHDAELPVPDGRRRILAQRLAELRLPMAIVDRAVSLVAAHDRPAASADAQTLANADVLSFFSRECPGVLDDRGREHTRRKIAHSLARLAPGERWRLSWIKLRADVAEIVREVGRAEARV